MKKLLFSLLILMTITVSVFAQEDPAREKIESARIALITERLELTPEQAEKFWPIYREYQEKVSGLRKQYMDARGNVQRRDLTEEESQQLIDLGLKMKEQQLDLEKTYSERLANVISNRQLLALRKAEDDFRRMLLERLEKRREMQRRMQNRKDQIDN